MLVGWGLAHRVWGSVQHHRAKKVAPWGGGLCITCPQQRNYPIAVHSAVSFAIEDVTRS